MKYCIYDLCGQQDDREVPQNEFIELLEIELESYIDVAEEKFIAWKFTELALSIANGKPFELDINGYKYTIEEE